MAYNMGHTRINRAQRRALAAEEKARRVAAGLDKAGRTKKQHRRLPLPPGWRTELPPLTATSKERRANLPGHTRSPCRYKRVWAGEVADAMHNGTLGALLLQRIQEAQR